MTTAAIMHDMIAVRLNEIEQEWGRVASSSEVDPEFYDQTIPDLITLCRTALHNLKPFAWPGAPWVKTDDNFITKCHRCGCVIDLVVEVRSRNGVMSTTEMTALTRKWVGEHTQCLPWVEMRREVEAHLIQAKVGRRGTMTGPLAELIVEAIRTIVSQAKAGKL